MQRDQHQVDQLDADERHDHAAQPVDQQITPQQRLGADALLRRNLLVWGLGGVIVPFIGIKLIDLIMVALHLVA